jgi:hypothetical protein
MGEAWFMSEERRMFDELLGDLDALPIAELRQVLEEIASGTVSFGSLDEWRDWFLYLLPHLVPRIHQRDYASLLEVTITALFTQYPAGLEECPDAGFREDVLNTLGQCQMDAACWPDGELDVEVCLDRYFIPRLGLWCWSDANGPLSASMFLCLKYLRADEVGTWLRSVLAIREPRWRAQVMSWLLGAHAVLTGAVRQPSKFDQSGYPRIDWDWSHCLSGDYYNGDTGECRRLDFIPEANREAALLCVKEHFDEAAFLDWLVSFETIPSVEAELAATPFWFFELYGSQHSIPIQAT